MERLASSGSTDPMHEHSNDHNANDTTGTVLVVGSTGKTGRRVAARLEARGIPVRHGSRGSAVPFDWEDPTTWAPAVAGVDQAYVTYYPDLALPGADEQVAELARLARAAGVRHLVLLSGRGEPGALAAEEAVRAAGPPLTVVRASWFAQNFSEGLFADLIGSGTLALPAGEVPEPFVDADDIADVAVAALTDPAVAGDVYEVTGPRLLTMHDVATDLSSATGRPVTYEPVTMERFAAILAEAGLPTDLIEALGYLFTEILDGRNAGLTDGVQRALGRPPKDFADFARDAAAAGAWDVGSPATS
ncbi:MAG TPA: NmrA family NAD(P)-binding protein [Acidimicrobiales bacterium]